MSRRLLLLFIPLLILTLFPPFIVAQSNKIKRAIDGDTLLLTNGEKGRFIGIDATEARANPRAEKQAGEEEGI